MKYALLLLSLALYADTVPSPGLSELDREKLRRIQLQLELLQKQVNESYASITKEQGDILDRVCAAAGLKRDVCEVNIETGAITKAKPPKDEKK